MQKTQKTQAKRERLALYTPVSKNYSDVTDNELLALFLKGNEKAFNELVERYQERLHNHINRMIGDTAQAEDIVQETFLRVYQHGDSFDTTKKFSTWIYTIAGNLAKNELRYRGRRPAWNFTHLVPNHNSDDKLPENNFKDQTVDPVKDCHLSFAMEDVDTALNVLPGHQRKVFVLRHAEGLTYQEIAKITRANVGTVKSRLFRAKEMLGSYLSHLNPKDA